MRLRDLVSQIVSLGHGWALRQRVVYVTGVVMLILVSCSANRVRPLSRWFLALHETWIRFVSQFLRCYAFIVL